MYYFVYPGLKYPYTYRKKPYQKKFTHKIAERNYLQFNCFNGFATKYIQYSRQNIENKMNGKNNCKNNAGPCSEVWIAEKMGGKKKAIEPV